jgi:peptidyl-tRNA hydrolase
MAAQATIGTDGGRDDSEHILEELPPEKLLDTPSFRLIRGGVGCMRSVETVKQYVAHENATEQREQVLRLLHQRAAELREQE